MSSNIIIGLSWSSEDSIYISEMTNAEDGVNSAQSVGNYEILPSERLVLLRLIQRIKARDRRTWVSGAGEDNPETIRVARKGRTWIRGKECQGSRS